MIDRTAFCSFIPHPNTTQNFLTQKTQGEFLKTLANDNFRELIATPKNFANAMVSDDDLKFT